MIIINYFLKKVDDNSDENNLNNHEEDLSTKIHNFKLKVHERYTETANQYREISEANSEIVNNNDDGSDHSAKLVVEARKLMAVRADIIKQYFSEMF